MSYYTGQGDYYSGKGDPGLFSSIGSIVSKVGGLLPGPIGAGAKILGGVLGGGRDRGSRPVPAPRIRMPGPSGFPGFGPGLPPLPRIGGRGAGAPSGTCPGGNPCGSGFHLDKSTGSKCVRNRRTNYTNPKALSRAAKRMDGFVSVARKALKSTNYKVVPKSYKQNYRKPLKR